MRKQALLLVGIVCLALVGTGRLSVGKDDAKEEKADFKVYDGYFESNKSGLKGEASFLVFTDKKGFDNVFRPTPPLLGGKKKVLLPDNAFEAQLVAAVVKRGDRVWTYKVTGVTHCKGKATITYEAKAGQAGGATFASPLIVAVARGGLARVVFVENGKEVGTAEIGK
jgi:hypothetical protein